MPGRPGDPWKPYQRKLSKSEMQRTKIDPNYNPKTTWTGMNIDHVVPRASLGWNRVDNLAVTCEFCNSGKQSALLPLEVITQVIAGGLAEYFEDLEYLKTLKNQIVVSTLRIQDGTCYKCNKTKGETEITVERSFSDGEGMSHVLSQWNLRSICYQCVETD